MELQPGMQVLFLNDMRSSNIENTEPVVCAWTREEIVAYCESERAPEPWRDERWGKVFKKGSPLEWYNCNFRFDGTGFDEICTYTPRPPPNIPTIEDLGHTPLTVGEREVLALKLQDGKASLDSLREGPAEPLQSSVGPGYQVKT